MADARSPPEDAPALVERLLNRAVARRASDLHVEPTASGCDVHFRIDGLLEPVERFDRTTGRALVTRLMVMARLLTYRLDVPQEGRLKMERPAGPRALEFRLAVMPTNHGLRAVVRLPAELTQPRGLDELQLPKPVLRGLKRFAAADSGMLMLVGPAGSGKTATIYALLEYIGEHFPGLSVVALEDPVERDIEGVTQIEVTPFGELTYERALRSILRQDPQVLVLGEIRDRASASIAVQATLSGHRLICTLHAGTFGGAVSRLLEMGVEPYQITSALFGVVSIRLLRKRNETGGFEGRMPVAEMATMDPLLRESILDRADAESMQKKLTEQNGYHSLRDVAERLVERGLTTAEEVRRVLGTESAAGA